MTEKELEIHEDSVAQFNALSESETAPSPIETFLQESAQIIKKTFCVVAPIALAVAPNVISPPAIHAQLTQAEIASRLGPEAGAVKQSTVWGKGVLPVPGGHVGYRQEGRKCFGLCSMHLRLSNPPELRQDRLLQDFGRCS